MAIGVAWSFVITSRTRPGILRMPEYRPEAVTISQSVAILVDGNNLERSIHEATGDTQTMLSFDRLAPRLPGNRGLNRLIYFHEGRQISSRLEERLYRHFHGSVHPCHKSADIPLTIKTSQLSSTVDTIMIMSGDSDGAELVSHLKSEGVRVAIAAVPATALRLLKDEADHFHAVCPARTGLRWPRKRPPRGPPRPGDGRRRQGRSDRDASPRRTARAPQASARSETLLFL